MANDRSLDNLTLKELGALALSLGLPKWTQLRKSELIDAIREFQAQSSKHSEKSKRGGKGRAGRSSSSSDTEEVSGRGRRNSSASSEPKRRGRKGAGKPSPTLFDVEGASSEEPEVRAPNKRGRGARKQPASANPTIDQIVGQVAEQTEQLVAGLVAELEEKNNRVEKTNDKNDKKKRARKGRAGRNAKEDAAESRVDEEPIVQAAPVEEPIEDVSSRSKKGANAKRKRQARQAEPAALEAREEEQVESKTSSKRSRKTRKNPLNDLKPVDKPEDKEPLFAVNDDVEPAVPTEAPKAVEESSDEEPKPRKRRARAKKNAPVEQEREPEQTPAEEPAEEPVQEAQPAEPTPEDAPKRKRRSRKNAKKEEESKNAESESNEFDAEPDFKTDPLNEEPTPDALEEEDSDDLLAGFDAEWIDADDEEDEEKEDELDTDDDDYDELDVDDMAIEEPEPEPEPEPELSEQSIRIRETMKLRKTIGSPTDDCDRLRLSVLDSYWLRASWQITPQLVERVRVAMGRFWHTADPILRVFSVDKEAKCASFRRERYIDVEIRGGVNSWYIAVDNPPCSFMVELGYRSRDGQFFTLASSNVVTTPQRYVHDSFKRPALEDGGVDRTRAPRRVRPTIDAPEPQTRPAADAFPVSPTFNRSEGAFARDLDDVKLVVDTEIVIKGQAAPGSNVSIKEEPIRLNEEGKFSVRYSLPERRHVFPVVMSSRDGAESQTIVLAIDRNTKTLEPIFKEDDED